jgi:Glycosyltransferase
MVKLLGMKAVYTHHGPDYDREKWGPFARFMLRLGERVGTRFADGIIVISSVIKDIIEKKYNRKDCHLIFNGAPKAYFNTDKSYLNELGIEPQKYVIGMWRFVPEKNLEHLISAFDKAFPKDKDGKRKDGMKLVLAGDADFKDGYYHRLERITKEQEVILPGFVRGEKLQVLLTNARCFVLPSSHEGLSIALLEAMSYKLPVIVSDIPANKVVGLKEESYFHLGNVEELAEKLQKNAEDEFHSIDYDMSRYDWDDIARKTVEVYNQLTPPSFPPVGGSKA